MIPDTIDPPVRKVIAACWTDPEISSARVHEDLERYYFSVVEQVRHFCGCSC